MPIKNDPNAIIGYHDVYVKDVPLDKSSLRDISEDLNVYSNRLDDFLRKNINTFDIQKPASLAALLDQETEEYQEMSQSPHQCEIINGQAIGVLYGIAYTHSLNMFQNRLNYFKDNTIYQAMDNNVLYDMQVSVHNAFYDMQDKYSDMSHISPLLTEENITRALHCVNNKDATTHIISSFALHNLYDIQKLFEEHQFHHIEKDADRSLSHIEKESIQWNISEKYVVPSDMPKQDATEMVSLAYYNHAELVNRHPYPVTSPRFEFDIFHVHSLQDEFERNAYRLLDDSAHDKMFRIGYSISKSSYDFKETFFDKLEEDKQDELQRYFAKTLYDILDPHIKERTYANYPLITP